MDNDETPIVPQIWGVKQMVENLGISSKTVDRDFGDLAVKQGNRKAWFNTEVWDRARVIYRRWEG